MKITIKILSLLLTVVILFTTLVSCFDPDSVNGDDDIDYTISDEKITEIVTEIIESLQKDNEKEENGDLPQKDNEKEENGDLPQKDNEKGENGDLPQKDNEKEDDEISDMDSKPMENLFSMNPDAYIGDLETFVYGLMINKLEYLYDVFPAYVQLSDGTFIYGLAYTDYSECYTNDDETKAYFSAGFLPGASELDVPEEEFDCGLYINNMEYSDDEIAFVWTYRSDEYIDHCVVYGTYLKYGISKTGKIMYSGVPYRREACDVTIGAIYSYDDSRYVYDPDVGNYLPITGVSLSNIIDYDELEREINAYIEAQNKNFYEYDTVTVAYTSQDAVISYLQTMQEETFLGLSVESLIQAAKSLDPKSCFEITPDGLSIVNIQEAPPEEATALAKWLIGGTCAIVTIAGMVGSVVFSACPGLSSLSGAVTGAAIDVFMQVVVEGKAIGEVTWSKVLLSAVSGAFSGLVGPYLQGAMSGAGYFIVDSLLDGLIGGIEGGISSWIDGDSGEEIMKNFGVGFGLGLALSAGFKGLGTVASKVGEGLSESAGKIAKKLSPSLRKSLSKFAKPISSLGNSIGDGIQKLKKKADSSIFYSKYLGGKQADKAFKLLTKAERDEAFRYSFGKGKMALERVVDGKGNVIGETKLKGIFNQAKNGDILGYIDEGGMKIPVVKWNNFVSIAGQDNFPTVKVIKSYNKYTSKAIRDEMWPQARENLRKRFVDAPNEIPENLYKAIKNAYPDVEVTDAIKTMNSTQWKTILGANGALHENLDGTVSYMPKEIHQNIGHCGAVCMELWIKQHMGNFYFETFTSAAASGAVIGAN